MLKGRNLLHPSAEECDAVFGIRNEGMGSMPPARRVDATCTDGCDTTAQDGHDTKVSQVLVRTDQ